MRVDEKLIIEKKPVTNKKMWTHEKWNTRNKQFRNDKDVEKKDSIHVMSMHVCTHVRTWYIWFP